MDRFSCTALELDKIVHFLSQCAQTDVGKEKARLLAPSDSMTEINQRLHETEEAKQYTLQFTKPRFLDIRQIRDFIEKAMLQSVLGSDQLFVLGNHLQNLRKFKESLREQMDSYPILYEYASRIRYSKEIETAIFSKIDANGEIKDDATSELKSIRHHILDTRNRIYDKLNELLNSSSYSKMFQDQVITIRSDRFVIPLKSEHKTHFPSIVHDQSVSGETVFVEPIAVTSLNNDYRILLLKQKREFEKILSELTVLVQNESKEILSALDTEEILDVLYAKAELAIRWKATCPTLVQEPIVKIENGRHPLIPDDKVVPISINMTDSYRTLIITGPNTGGKTVTLKTVGLFTLMTYCGLHIPASENSVIGHFSSILADIGEEQSIEQNLSSFSSHMSNIILIIETADPSSLILLDELGAGTDPDEGAALGMAVLSYFHRLHSLQIISTHLSLIKSFAYNFPGAENACVGFDLETLKPTYHLLMGVPGQSHAFQIAARLGMNEELISTAERYISRTDQDQKKLIEGLKKKSEEMEMNRQETEAVRLRIQELESSHRAELEAIIEKNKQIKEDLVQKYTADLNKLSADMKKIVKELARKDISPSQQNQIIQEFEQNKETLDEKLENLQSLFPEESIHYEDVDTEIKKFDTVMVELTKQTAIVINTLPDKDKVEVQFPNSIRMVLSRNKIRKIINPPTETDDSEPELPRKSMVAQKIDVHGLRTEEALPLIDKYLDDAYLAGHSQVWILHGIGTGILREEIRKHLKQHPHVSQLISQPGHTIVVLRNEVLKALENS
ncbi:endonuclease MutS2 [bacterium]|nr:endonuclease MutS2 [bacterium]